MKAGAIPAVPRAPTLALTLAMSLSLLLAAGCNVPALAPPQALQELPAGSADITVRPDWWTHFGDSRLDALVQEALAQNRDLARAVERINEARVALRLSDADQAPSVSAGASAARRRSSRNSGNPQPNGPYATDLSASLNVSYEADLWGRLAALSRSDREELLATRFSRDTVALAVAAQVVQGDALMQALESQRALYAQAVQAQSAALELQRVRLNAGDIAELDIRQLEAELAASEVQLPQLTRAIGDAERSLSVLLGRSPKAVLEGRIERGEGLAKAVPAAAMFPQGLPSDLLLRRPDVQAAEARLRAAGARMDAVRAAYFPSLMLTGGFGRQSSQLSNLLSGPSAIWNVMASLTQPIWNAGRLEAGFDSALAQRRQVELDYRDAVATAFREAGDALAAQDESRQTLATLERRLATLKRASELTHLRFNGGIASRLDDINAQRAALAAAAQVEDARRAVRSAQVGVFKALGGGWDVKAAAPPGRP